MDRLQGDTYTAVGTLYRDGFESRGISRQELEDLLDVLIRHDFVGTETKVFQKDGRDISYRVLSKIRPLGDELNTLQISDLQLSSKTRRAGASAGTSTRKKRKAPVSFDYDKALFEQLREWRIQESRRSRIPVFRILSDNSLKEIACIRPKSEAELLQVSGVGPNKFKKFGKKILDLMR